MIVPQDQLARVDRPALGPFGRPYLAIGLDGDSNNLPDWLRHLPCPVIGVGAWPQASPHVDTVVPDADALAPLVASIEKCPIAAMILVQLLRMIEPMEVHDALIAESLAYASLQGGPENCGWLQSRKAPPRVERDAGPAVVLARNGAALDIMLNRPHALNAINLAMRDALGEGLALAAMDKSIETICIEGAGRCFSIGGALEEFGTAPDQATSHAVRCMAGPAFGVVSIADRTTAVVHGACIGAGAELASLCKRVRVRGNAFFQLPEIGFGLIPGSGGTVGMLRRIGRQRAAYLMLSGRRISAARALAWGLVDEICA